MAVNNLEDKQQLKIGDLLVNHGLITAEQLQEALAKQKDSGDKLGKVLIDMGAIEEKRFLEFFAEQLGMPLVDLTKYKIVPAVCQRLPEAQSHLFHTVLLGEDDGHYLIGMADPQDIFAVDEMTRLLRRPLNIALLSENDLEQARNRIYTHAEEITEFAQQLASELRDTVEEETTETDTAVFNLITSLFEDAVQVGASDIHIEPDEEVLRIRMRVDGMLREQIIDNKGIAAAVAQRLKLMSGLNIAEKRLPQDGRFNITVKKMPIDVRLSTMPIQYGESVVMRLLNQATGILDLNVLGMSESILTRFRHLIHMPKGIILVTGPTGSGKTTTLYAALNEMNDVEKKFITIEDPVEYRLPRINQIQVNTQLDLTFARVLRSALRQDPDILLVGEIRDKETASIAMRAALTGHLVLATLHTNDAASSAMRLIDMGVEGYLVAATVYGALAQRLVRKICSGCKEEYAPNQEETTFFREFFGEEFTKNKYYHGRGCEHCNNTGYRGRLGVYELLEFDDEMREALRMGDANAFNHLVEKDKMTRSLLANAYELAVRGETTLNEALRIAGEQE